MTLFIIGLLLALIPALIYIFSLWDERKLLRQQISHLQKLIRQHADPKPSVRIRVPGYVQVDDFA
jgi:hypothetical protein